MWQVKDLDFLLPVGIHVYEDSESVMLHCLWCGWESRYAAGGPSGDQLVKDARAHQCGCVVRYDAIEKWGRLDD